MSCDPSSADLCAAVISVLLRGRLTSRGQAGIAEADCCLLNQWWCSRWSFVRLSPSPPLPLTPLPFPFHAQAHSGPRVLMFYCDREHCRTKRTQDFGLNICMLFSIGQGQGQGNLYYPRGAICCTASSNIRSQHTNNSHKTKQHSIT